MFKKFTGKVVALRDHNGGAVILLFGLALIPLFGFIGVAVDYGMGVRDASLLGAAADAAALSAVSPKSAAYQLAQATQGDATLDVDPTPYIDLMKANLGPRAEMTLQTAPDKLKVTIKKVGMNITATVTATAAVKTSIMSMFGFNAMNVTKTSTASTNLPAFLDFYLLLDNTPSMGIAATPTDIDNLQKHTAGDVTYLQNVAGQKGKCGFTCHDLSQQGQNPVTDTYLIARQNNVTLRIDLLRQATQNLMTTAAQVEARNSLTDQFRFAVYTFGNTSTDAQNNAVTNVVPLSSNLSSVASQASAVDLMTVDTGGEYNDQDTSFDTALPALGKVIPNPGDGSSTTSRQQYLIFITDGVADENLNGTRTIEVLNDTLCEPIKKHKIQIAILYTTYYELKNNDYYNAHVAPIASNIGPALQQCASSPDLYQEVGIGGDVSDALNGLFQKIVSKSRLTQ